ncbi:MAG: DEAD/DEAH box helicase [Lachnospiraceae bacterium]|nr:DEAD/DEAH box helicase [Lachnospiraceae bacterium]
MDSGLVDTKLRFLITETGFTLETAGIPDPKNDILNYWYTRFREDRYKALYDIGFNEKPDWLDAAGSFLYLVSDAFQRYLLRLPELELLRENVELRVDEDIEERLLNCVPFSPGSEYIDGEWIGRCFERLFGIFALEIKNFKGSIQLYLDDKSQHLRVPERIFFHIVENEKDENYPFAFMATYSTRVKRKGIAHKPLQYALTEYKNDRERLMILLSCLNRASEVSELIDEFVRSGEMFHPLRLTSSEAYRLLKDVPKIEEIGIICRIPNWWKKNAASVFMNVNIGQDKAPMLGLDTMISMVPELSVDGVPLSEEEIERLLMETEGLAYLKGRWVEVDHARLRELLTEMKGFCGEISLKDALRMQMGENIKGLTPDVGALVSNGAWLNKLLSNMRAPAKIRQVALPKNFNAVLRPYQNTGYTWLNYMNKIGFGACLADDMGLGKTVQILAYLQRMYQDNKAARVLLIVPASLLGNWEKEIEKFAPKMNYFILHGGAKLKGKLLLSEPSFLTITTYATALRVEELSKIEWDAIILDEAQAIKNPISKQTRQIKALNGRMKIAMTGTPIENDLSNLWSLFDFLNKGLLGTSTEFHDFCNKLDNAPEGYAHLKAMISPFMLRRLKTDKSIISDLPDKLEQIEYVTLSKKQAVLYRKYVMDLEQKLSDKLSNMERKGLVLAALIKLKQICNHPDQYLGQKLYEEKDSGKFGILREICETIYEKRERVLVFTQFKEIIPYLDDFLAEIFKQRGLTLHGGTHVSTRAKLVEAFQGEDYVPYMILSVKAGGTGLNLTKASHVIHFDRWWNPAVENQATDRAFRIGQKNNVIVHKLVCERTIEEKINTIIESKKELAENVVGSGSENWITEMNDEELLNILRLDA